VPFWQGQKEVNPARGSISPEWGQHRRNKQIYLKVGVVLLTAWGGSRVPFGGAIPQEAGSRFAQSAFLFPFRLQKPAFDAHGKQKARSTVCSGFSLVDKVIEPLARRSQISNLGLVRDIYKILVLLVDKNVPGGN